MFIEGLAMNRLKTKINYILKYTYKVDKIKYLRLMVCSQNGLLPERPPPKQPLT